MRNVALGLITLSLAAAYLVATLDVPRSILDGPVGARGFPNLIGWSLVCASVLLIARSLLFRQKAASDGEADNQEWASPGRAALRAAGLAAIAVAYLLVLPVLGYLLSTFLLIAVGVLYQEWRAPAWALAVAASGSFVFWLLFAQLLRIPLPAGLPGRWF